MLWKISLFEAIPHDWKNVPELNLVNLILFIQIQIHSPSPPDCYAHPRILALLFRMNYCLSANNSKPARSAAMAQECAICGLACPTAPHPFHSSSRHPVDDVHANYVPRTFGCVNHDQHVTEDKKLICRRRRHCPTCHDGRDKSAASRLSSSAKAHACHEVGIS